MTLEERAHLQVVWEQLNGALFDLTEGRPEDAIPAVQDCIDRLEAMGISHEDTYDEFGVNTRNTFNTPPKGV